MTTTTAQPPRFNPGDRVVPDPAMDGHPASVLGKVFIVDRRGPKNLIMRAEEGGPGYRAPDGYMLPAPAPGERAPIGRPFVERPWIDTGSIVTLKRAYQEIKTDTPMVVIKGGDSKVNVVRLGDTSGRYVRAPVASIELRDLAWLTERLVEMA